MFAGCTPSSASSSAAASSSSSTSKPSSSSVSSTSAAVSSSSLSSSSSASSTAASTSASSSSASKASSSPAAASSSTTALKGTIKASGSTSVEKLAKAFGEAFSAKNKNVTVEVQGGGSGAAVTDVKNGVSEIGSLSRALKDTEKAEGFKEYQIAIDGIAVIVNPKNTVKDLTTEQIAKIFTGEITNWKDVGGPDAAIVPIGREAGSGTRDGFEEIVKVKDKCKYTSELNETGQVKAQVAATEGAVGYISLGYVDNSIKAVSVGGVAPTTATVKDGTYKIQR
ncbi:MAG TPA: phosphate ABC transporter substrate-binding protein, partial [Ruminococcaceae bacterium]|nr:phosphate ABC transporter substrate-binding protein [Oscillospiraceae bacterium]